MTRPPLFSTVSAVAACKCCGAAAPAFGEVDFNKSCLDTAERPVLPPSGLGVGYYRCGQCGFLFTTGFDHFTHEDFQRHIYNEQYVLVDPEYADIRPRKQAREVAAFFPKARSRRVLDFGGGSGVFAALLRELGYQDVTTYDPFVPEFSNRPTGTFDMVTCFEVLEHVTNPREVIADLIRFMGESGVVAFSTMFQPPDIAERGGVGWWYVAPRNGHVSLFTREAVGAAIGPCDLTLHSFDTGAHMLFRTVPDFALR